MIRFEWHDVRTPVFISCWMVFILIVKIVFHASEKLVVLPDSALMICAGFVVGTILDQFVPHDIYLDPDLFFLYLLPPIALEAGYFLPNKHFFKNIGTILAYAILGTLWNICATGIVLYVFSLLFGFSMSIPLIDVMLFSTLISAVDPVAVLSVFTEINVNELLYICVFGESLLNDAVTIVLYHSLSDMMAIGSDHLVARDFAVAFGNFVLVSFGGVVMGLLFAVFTGLTTKFAGRLDVAQPLICLLLPYLSYLLAEFAHFSGILAIVTCGLLMKPYISDNISEESRITVKYFIKTIASHCEAMIFIFLGLSTFSRNHSWDLAFSVLTVVACLCSRFVGTYLLSYLCNRNREEKIGLVDQFIMAYGGLRGAICYGLAMTLDKDSVPAKDIFVSTTVVIICFTVFVQGTTIRPLVKFLRVKTKSEQRDKLETYTDVFVSCARDLTMTGIEAIAGIHGKYYWSKRMAHLDREYVRPFLTHEASTPEDELVRNYDRVDEKNLQRQLKRKSFGSSRKNSSGVLLSSSNLQQLLPRNTSAQRSFIEHFGEQTDDDEVAVVSGAGNQAPIVFQTKVINGGGSVQQLQGIIRPPSVSSSLKITGGGSGDTYVRFTIPPVPLEPSETEVMNRRKAGTANQ